MSAKFITFEGSDGAGKTTLIEKIKSHLMKQNIPFIVTREPGGPEVSEEIRETLLKPGRSMDAYTEFFLYCASRSEHVLKIIKPALAAGKTVLCDRYVHSSYAFQGYGRGIDLSFIEAISEKATHGVMPDLTVWLKLDLEESQKRMQNRGELSRLDAESMDFKKRVFEGFKKLAAHPKYPMVTFDVFGKNPDEVFEMVTKHPKWSALF